MSTVNKLKRRELKASVIFAVLLVSCFGVINFNGRLSHTESTSNISSALAKGCQDQEGLRSKQNCWNDLVSRALSTNNLDNSYQVFSYLYDHDPDFPNECHDIAHKIGVAAYRIVTTGGDIKITPETSYCGFGFYHGFMELFLKNGQNILKAQKFCEDATKQIQKAKPAVVRQCYHGIGHGSLDIDNVTLRANTELLLSKAEQVCLAVSSSRDIRQVCGTGVYNAFSVSYFDPQYQLQLDLADPYQICTLRQSYFIPSCYTYVTLLMRKVLNEDFLATATLVSKIQDATNRSYAIAPLSDLVSSEISKNGINAGINKCRLLNEDMVLTCIEDLPMYLITQAQPGHEKTSVIALCSSVLLGEVEKQRCFTMAFNQLSGIYPRDKWDEVCSGVDPSYKKYCIYSE